MEKNFVSVSGKMRRFLWNRNTDLDHKISTVICADGFRKRFLKNIARFFKCSGHFKLSKISPDPWGSFKNPPDPNLPRSTM